MSHTLRERKSEISKFLLVSFSGQQQLCSVQDCTVLCRQHQTGPLFFFFSSCSFVSVGRGCSTLRLLQLPPASTRCPQPRRSGTHSARFSVRDPHQVGACLSLSLHQHGLGGRRPSFRRVTLPSRASENVTIDSSNLCNLSPLRLPCSARHLFLSLELHLRPAAPV